MKPFRVTNFDEETTENLRNYLGDAIASGAPVAVIEVDSGGGDVNALFGMVDIIVSAQRQMKVATVAVGRAMSAGAVLLSCGSPGMRYCSPNAAIMVHPVSACASGKLGDMVVDLNQAKRDNKRIFALLRKNTKKTAAFFAKKLAHNLDWYMDAREAKAAGLVDVVDYPFFIVRSETQYHFA